MLQVGSISNFFNTSVANHLHTTTAIHILQYTSNNVNLWFVTPPTHFDRLNGYSSGYRRANKLQPLTFLNYLVSSFILQWAYIAFRGKSFRVRNFCKFNKFTFNFGYSHWTKLILLKNWAFFKRRRQRYIVYSYFYKDFKFFSRFFPKIRFYNCYTMRGLRFRKQAIIRRFGKISQHISILH